MNKNINWNRIFYKVGIYCLFNGVYLRIVATSDTWEQVAGFIFFVGAFLFFFSGNENANN